MPRARSRCFCIEIPDDALQLYKKAATIDAFKLSIVRLGQPVAIEVKVK